MLNLQEDSSVRDAYLYAGYSQLLTTPTAYAQEMQQLQNSTYFLRPVRTVSKVERFPHIAATLRDDCEQIFHTLVEHYCVQNHIRMLGDYQRRKVSDCLTDLYCLPNCLPKDLVTDMPLYIGVYDTENYGEPENIQQESIRNTMIRANIRSAVLRDTLHFTYFND